METQDLCVLWALDDTKNPCNDDIKLALGSHQLPMYCLLLLICTDAKIKKNLDETSINKKNLYSLGNESFFQYCKMEVRNANIEGINSTASVHPVFPDECKAELVATQL